MPFFKRFSIQLPLFFAVFLIGSISIASAKPTIHHADFVKDAEFPHLLPYIIDGYDLKHGMFVNRKYADLVDIGGNIQLLLFNDSDKPFKLKQLKLDGADLVKHLQPVHYESQGIRAASYLLNDTTTTPPNILNRLEEAGDPIWYQIRPNPVPSGQFSEVTIRLRQIPTHRKLRVEIIGQDNTRLSTRIDFQRPSLLRIAFIAFEPDMCQAKLYLRHQAGKNFQIRSLQFDGQHLPLKNELNLNSYNGFLPLEFDLKTPVGQGTFHAIEVATTEGKVTALIRAWPPDLALGMWGYRNWGNSVEERAADTCKAFHDHLFNTHMGMAGSHSGYLRKEEGLELLKEMNLRLMTRDPMKHDIGHPQLYARFLMDEPDAHEAAIDSLPGNRRLGAFAQGLVKRRDDWTHTDPLTPCLLNVDLTYKPENWITYGQLPDIFALDPYYLMRLKSVYWKHPGWLARYCHPYYVFALSEVARFGCEPKPLHVILNSVSARDKNSDRAFRYSTPDEKRIEFYYALAAGAKGISYWWFTPYGWFRGCGADEPAAKALMQEMARLNAEARALATLFSTSCPESFPGDWDTLVETRPTWLMPRTLFSGTDTMIVILINRDHLSDLQGSRYEPIEKSRVFFTRPPWLSIQDAFRFKQGQCEPLDLTSEEDFISTELEQIELTEVLIFTKDLNLRSKIQKQWEIQDRLLKNRE